MTIKGIYVAFNISLELFTDTISVQLNVFVKLYVFMYIIYSEIKLTESILFLVCLSEDIKPQNKPRERNIHSFFNSLWL